MKCIFGGNQKFLCKEVFDCDFCWEKSFASCNQSEFWNYNKNILNPREIPKYSSKICWFTCQYCNHDFSSSLNNITNMNAWCPYCAKPPKKLCAKDDCKVCFEKSFASNSYSRFWNYTKNKITPRETFKVSGKKFWFTCANCKHDFETRLCIIDRGAKCPYCCTPPRYLCDKEDCKTCLDKSFATHEKAVFWNYNKNKLTPRQFFKRANLKAWFRCEDCKHDLHLNLNNMSDDKWCSYCINRKFCDKDDCKLCFEKSFASHEKARYWIHSKNTETPRNIGKNTHKKFWFKCEKCFHEFNISPEVINLQNQWCPYCCYPPQKLCDKDDCKRCFEKSFASHEKVKYWIFELNEKNPRFVFKNSHNKYFFKCNYCHSNFEISPQNVNQGSWCSYCIRKTEKIIADYLSSINIEFEREKAFSWCVNEETNKPFRYDFYLPNEKIIIEVDGNQHYKENKHFRSGLDEIQYRDMFKEEKAKEKGLKIIRICQEDVYKNKFDWKIELKNAINSPLKYFSLYCRK